jgi:hypothetical protein
VDLTRRIPSRRPRVPKMRRRHLTETGQQAATLLAAATAALAPELVKRVACR